MRGTSGSDNNSGDRLDDAALVERILADPAAGWAEAWDRYGRRLHGYCRRRVDDPNEADDVVADVFLVASQRIESLRDPGAFRAWLHAIARRRVQETWRHRERSTPVDPHGETAMSATAAPHEVSGADDAAALVTAASASLNDRDRDLLALALDADLDTGEIARVTGESVSFVSLRVNRLKERIGRAAGALLVARHHRRDCDELRRISSTRPAPHDAPTGTGPELAFPELAVTDLGPWDDDGFPTTARRRGRALVVGVAAVAIALAVGGLVLLIGAGDDGADAVVAADTATTTTRVEEPEVSPPPGGTETPPESTTTTTVAPPATRPPITQLSVPEPTTTSDPPPSSSTSTTTTVPAPTVAVSVTPRLLYFDHGDGFARATITVRAQADGVVTTVSWDGPDAGQVTVPGVGTHVDIPVGPMVTPPGVEGRVVTVVATVTDGAGGVATATTSFTVQHYLV